jgi:hypothetical protein
MRPIGNVGTGIGAQRNDLEASPVDIRQHLIEERRGIPTAAQLGKDLDVWDQ